MKLLDFAGQTLDDKYRIERELGRGGMGTVFLATHLGTERSVAVKIISPQFMQRVEFVERFRREARAAGRLRHPNVVDVTDFGFADTDEGQVAYLVMEYLDGCTLGEILEEEKNLPVGWTLDILEQVCSAVHEAHEQGIIHRDLKPDNIWLEPNQRGGYTVKVLDFGIAKLEEHAVANGGSSVSSFSSFPTYASPARVTMHGSGRDGTIAEGMTTTHISEASTIAQTADQGTQVSETGTLHLNPINSEGKTAVFDDGDVSGDYQETIGTKVISEQIETDRSNTENRTTGRSLYESTSNSAELTRVGAVLGTPLYMSPEQCRGEHLDPRSDIYSLGVIAYQMLSGAPPFEGDFKDVMLAHKETEPRPLATKKVRRKMKRAIHSALAKDPGNRPQSAEAFASELRSRSEGIFDLLRRALVIYSEHLPKFLLLTGFFSLPLIVLTLLLVSVSFLKVSDVISETAGNVLIGIAGFLLSIASAFCTNLIVGTNAWIVIQYLAVPLRPIRLRPALAEARRKWKRLAGSGILTALLPFVVCLGAAIVGFAAFGLLGLVFYPLTGTVKPALIAAGLGSGLMGTIGFFYAYIVWILVPPVVMMENVRIREGLRRSRTLVKRSFATAAGAVSIIFLIPFLIAGTISYVVHISARAFDPKSQTNVENDQKLPETPASTETPPASETSADPGTPPPDQAAESDSGINWGFGKTAAVKLTGEKKDMRTRVKTVFLETIIQIFWLPMQILVFSFSAIIVALLYLKTRLAGGESKDDLIERFEDNEQPRKKWQERVRQRLRQSGRIPSKP